MRSRNPLKPGQTFHSALLTEDDSIVCLHSDRLNLFSPDFDFFTRFMSKMANSFNVVLLSALGIVFSFISAEFIGFVHQYKAQCRV